MGEDRVVNGELRTWQVDRCVQEHASREAYAAVGRFTKPISEGGIRQDTSIDVELRATTLDVKRDPCRHRVFDSDPMVVGVRYDTRIGYSRVLDRDGFATWILTNHRRRRDDGVVEDQSCGGVVPAGPHFGFGHFEMCDGQCSRAGKARIELSAP